MYILYLVMVQMSLKYGVMAQQSCLFVSFHVYSYSFLYMVNNVRLVLMSLCFVPFYVLNYSAVFVLFVVFIDLCSVVEF